MKRIHRLLITTCPILLVWAAALTQISGNCWIFTALAPIAPVVGLGGYMLVSLIHGVVTFHTVPEEYESLKKDVAQAREELEALGVLSN